MKEVIDSIEPVDATMAQQIRRHLDSLTKPPGSLGRLEEIALKYCLITGTLKPMLGNKAVIAFAGDHGVASEGVSAFPKEVTPQMVRNMLAGGAAISVLARHVGAKVRVVDIGVADPLKGAAGLVRRKIRPGTDNIAVGPAMTLEEAGQAIGVGIEMADWAASEEVTLLGTGEMGIANTTPSAALFAALLPASVEEVTGLGTGIDDKGLRRKIEVIHRALRVNQDELSNPLGALASLGGFEIAGIAGLLLGAAAHRIPVVVDGFISSVGALVACRMCESVRGYLFFSHCSDEAGHATFFELFKAEPILDLRMRLGEGTGAALAMSIIEASVKIYNEMATFDSAGVSEKD